MQLKQFYRINSWDEWRENESLNRVEHSTIEGPHQTPAGGQVKAVPDEKDIKKGPDHGKENNRAQVAKEVPVIKSVSRVLAFNLSQSC